MCHHVIPVRTRTSPTFSNSFSHPFQPLVHWRYSFTTAPRFLRSLSHLFPSPISAYRPYLFLISTVSPFGFLLFPPTPIFSPIPTSAASLSHRCLGSFLSHLRSPPFPRSPHSLRTVGTFRSAFPMLAPLFPRTVRTLSRLLHCSSHSIVVTLYCSLVTVTPPDSI